MSQRTPLYETHVRAGARLVEFAGWEMPVQYAGILAEHEAVRTRVGLFDVSHMGEVVFRGPKALEALNRVFTNDLSKVADGQAQYGCLCRETGGIVDDVVVYRRSADDLLVCVNAGNRQKDFDWLAAHAGGADVKNESDDWAQLALQGPRAAQLLQRLTKVNLSQLRSYRFAPGDVAGIPCLVARRETVRAQLREVHLRQPLQELGGARALQRELRPVVRLVLHVGAAGVRGEPVEVLLAVPGVHADEEILGGAPVHDDVVHDPAGLAAEAPVLRLAVGDLGEVVREDPVERRERLRAAEDDLAHVRHVEEARARPDRLVLRQDPGVLDRHLPPGELHQAGAGTYVSFVEGRALGHGGLGG